MIQERVTSKELLYMEDLACDHLQAAMSIVSTLITSAEENDPMLEILSENDAIHELIATTLKKYIDEILISSIYSKIKMQHLKDHMIKHSLDRLYKIIYHHNRPNNDISFN